MRLATASTIFASLVSMALVAITQAEKLITLNEILPGDLVTLDLRQSFDKVVPETLLFPSLISNKSGPISIGKVNPAKVYYTTGEAYDFKELLGFANIESDTGYTASVVALTKFSKLMVFEVKCKSKDKCVPRMKNNIDMTSHTCTQFVTLQFAVSKGFNDLLYCYEEDTGELSSFNAADSSSSPFSTKSKLVMNSKGFRLNDHFTSAPMEGGHSMVYNYYKWPLDKSKPDIKDFNGNTNVLIMTRLDGKEEFQEHVLDTNDRAKFTSFKFSALHYFGVHSFGESAPTVRLLLILGTPDANPDELRLKVCSYNPQKADFVENIKPLGVPRIEGNHSNLLNIVEVKISKSVLTQNGYDVYLEVTTLETNKSLLITEIIVSIEQSFAAAAEAKRIFSNAILDAAGVTEVAIKQESQYSRLYLNASADSSSLDILFRELISSDSAGNKKVVYDNDQNFVYSLTSNSKDFVRVNKAGYLNMLDDNYYRVTLNTSRLNFEGQSSSTVEIRACLIKNCIDSESEVFKFDLNFAASNYSVPQVERICPVVRGYHSRLCFHNSEVLGPLYDVNFNNDSHQLYTSNVNRINYFRMNSNDSKPNPIDIYANNMTGTLDYLFDYTNFELYRCRLYSTNLADGSLNVVCKMSKSFKQEEWIKHIKIDTLLDFKIDFNTIMLLYSYPPETQDLSKVNICYLSLNVTNFENVQYHHSEDCVGGLQDNDLVKSQIVIGPTYSYFFYLTSSDLKGFYIPVHSPLFDPIEIPDLKRDSRVMNFFANLKDIEDDSRTISLAVTGDSKHYTLQVIDGKPDDQSYDILVARDALNVPINFCSMSNNSVFSSFEDVYTLEKQDIVKSLYNKEKNTNKDSVPLRLTCVDNMMTLVDRPESKMFSIIRDDPKGLYHDRKRNEISFKHAEIDSTNSAYWSGTDLYLLNRFMRPFHFDLNGSPVFLRTKSISGSLEARVQDIFNSSNSEKLQMKFESYLAHDEDKVMNLTEAKSKWIEEEYMYSLTLNDTHFTNGSHFWKVDEVNNLPYSKYLLKNRFNKVNFQNYDTLCSAFITGGGLEACYRAGSIHISKNFKHVNFANSLSYSLEFAVEFVDLAFDNKVENTYYLLMRQDTGHNSTLVFITLKILNTKIRISVNPNAFAEMNHEVNNLETLWKFEKVVVGWLDPADSHSLILSSPTCKNGFFTEKRPKYALSFTMTISDKALAQNPDRKGYLFYTRYGDDDLYVRSLDLDNCSSEDVNVSGFKDENFPMRYFNKLHCEFKNDSDTQITCVFSGARLFLFELEIIEDGIKKVHQEEYIPYKNMEAEDIIISEKYFIIKYSRINHIAELLHDQSGVIYYPRKATAGGDGYVSGGINNLELLQIGARKKFYIHMSSNSTLTISTGTKVSFYNISEPSLQISKLELEERIKGPEIMVLGNQMQRVKLWPVQPAPKKVDRSLQLLIIVLISMTMIILIFSTAYIRMRRHHIENAVDEYGRADFDPARQTTGKSNAEINYSGSILG